MGIEIGGRVKKVNGKELSYDEFAEKYLAKNEPVVLTGLMDEWRARRDWVTENGNPNLQFFATHFGKSKVQIADCGTREFTDQKRVGMTVSEFVNHWTAALAEDNSNSVCDDDKSTLYLKDWHFVKEYPRYTAYETPLPFCDDWLNIYLDNFHMHSDPDNSQVNDEISCSDYRFVYMGAKGSWTPLHADVFRSYSWSSNVCGRKRWLFLSPSQSHFVFDRCMKNCVFDIFEDVNETKFPGFKKTIWLECIQEQDEIIFVPSGWYHQVHNLEDAISINHNWFNAYSLSWVWNLLLKDYKETVDSIEDIRDICDDFEAICQRNLAANSGMNFYDFFMFMSRFAAANVVLLHNLFKESQNKASQQSSMARNLVLNLSVIQSVMLKMKRLGGLADNTNRLDLRQTFKDPRFRKLCTDLGRTYMKIHHSQETWNFDAMCFENHKNHLGSPEDLVNFVDRSVSGFGFVELMKPEDSEIVI